MSWLAGAVGLVAAVLLVKKAVAFLKPLPDDGKRHCPHCGHAFEGERRYCHACKGQIWDDVLTED